jgi:hypothetical protein
VPETGDDVELEIVGSGQVYPLVKMTLSQVHLATRAAVSHGVGHRAQTRYLEPAGSLDERGQQPYSLVAGFAHAVQHGRLRAVAGGIAADEVEAFRSRRRFEEARGCVEALGGGRTAGQQHVLFHEGRKPEHPLVEPGGRECPVEPDGVVADEEHQDPLGATALDPAQCAVELGGAQFDVDLIQDPGPAPLSVGTGRPGRSPGPDVVVSDDAPLADPQFPGHPAHRGQQLALGGLAGQEHARGLLAALVQRGVHVGNASGDARRDHLPDGGDVPAGDGIDSPRRDEGVELMSHLVRCGATVHRDQAQLPAEYAGPAVDLINREVRAGLTRRSEYPGRALQGNDQGDLQNVSCWCCRRRTRQRWRCSCHRLAPTCGSCMPPDTSSSKGLSWN